MFSANGLPTMSAVLLMFALPLLGQSGASGCNPMTCEERVEASNDYIWSVIDENLSCEMSSDCTTVNPGTGCMGACPVPINLEGVDAVLEAVQYANAIWCEDFMSDGCPYATPSCLAFEPICEAGICAIAPY